MSPKIELRGTDQHLPSSTDAAVWWDFVFIFGYTVALGSALYLACKVFWGERATNLARAAVLLAVLGVLADIAENVLLLLGSSHTSWLDWASACAVLKFSCLSPAAVVALVGLLVTSWRLASASKTQRKPITVDQTFPLTSEDPTGPLDTQKSDLSGRWRRGYFVPEGSDDQGDVVGICLSGGGVRSASVALGALQAMHDVVRQARYLVSVSGGGYVAGRVPNGTYRRDRPGEREPRDSSRVRRLYAGLGGGGLDPKARGLPR